MWTSHAWRCRSIKPRLNCISDRKCLHSYLLTSVLFPLYFFSPPSFTLPNKSRIMLQMCFVICKYYITCHLNTFQGEHQKLKIFLRKMNVSEAYCYRIIMCDRWIIWKWFCAHTNAWLLCIALTFLRVCFETANAFAACLIFFPLFLVFPPPLFLLFLSFSDSSIFSTFGL